MKDAFAKALRTVLCCWITTSLPVAAYGDDAVRVTLDNFTRAETDLYFAKIVKDGAFGKFTHAREVTPVDKQDVIRMNRDTLYSYAVIDLSGGSVEVEMPQTDGRFMALQVIDEDHYTPAVFFEPGTYQLDDSRVTTRYALLLVRTFVNPNDARDVAAVHRMQDQLRVIEAPSASFSIPNWDTTSASRIRTALNALAEASGGIDSERMFGARGEVDPVQHLIGTAAGWGGNPKKVALYEGVTPEKNDGNTVYELTVQDVPVDGFWSISVYNKDGFFEKNSLDAYSVNNVTAVRERDGSVTVRFGGCDAASKNCLPTIEGWNYLVRMYRPRQAVLNGSWKFPRAQAVE